MPHRAGLLASGSQRFSVRLPILFRTVAGSLHHERMSCSPVTVARETAPDLHRLPYSAYISGHPMRTIMMNKFPECSIYGDCARVKQVDTRPAYNEASACKCLISTAIPAIIKYTRSAACASCWLIYPSVSR